MKTCIHCCVKKPFAAFGLYKRSKDGCTAQCKNCRNQAARATVDREAERARYHRDKAKHALMRAAYNEANADRNRARVKRWRAQNPEHLCTLKKKYVAGRVERAQDGYVRALLAGKRGPLKPADVPQALVELKKQHLRLCRELGKENREDC